MNKQSAVISEQYYKGVQMLPPAERGEAYEAYLEYAFYGKEYQGQSLAIKVLLASVTSSIDKANENYKKKVERISKVNEKRNNDIVHSRNDIVRNRNDIVRSRDDNARNRNDIVRSRDDIVSVTDTVTVTDTVNKTNVLLKAVSNPVQEKLNEYFDFLEQLDQKPLSLKARQVITQKLVSITDIETKQIQLIDKAMSNGWRNVYEREETPAESAKNGQQGDITDLDAWLNKMASEGLA